MQLRYAPNSPFVRKVMVVAIEAGIQDRIEKIDTDVTPLEEFKVVARDNPLVKVPSLRTDEGVSLFDSRVICEYLDSLNNGPKMFPKSGPARWTALRQQSLSDGILDAAAACRYEVIYRPEDKQWPPWIEGQMRKVRGGLDALENEIRDVMGPPTIGQISIACALGWLEIRLNENWRNERPALSDWFDRFSMRPSMKMTAPLG